MFRVMFTSLLTFQTKGRLATRSAVELSRTYQYVHSAPKGSVNEYTLFNMAAKMTNIPSEKMTTRGTFFFL